MPPTIARRPEPPPVEDGVIEEARRRQRRRWILGAALAAALAAVVASLVVGFAGSGGGTRAFGAVPTAGPYHLTWVHGRPYVAGEPFRIAVSPDLQPGQVGLEVLGPGGGGGGGPYPGSGVPFYQDAGVYDPPTGETEGGRVGPQGEIDYFIAAPGVASVRVPGLGTFPTVAFPGLPAGDRLLVFHRPPGSAGTVVVPGSPPLVPPGGGRAIVLVPLDGRGRVVPAQPIGGDGTPLPPVRYFTDGRATPTAGRCALTTTLADAAVQWGETSLTVGDLPSAPSVAFLDCLNTWFTLPGGHAFETALLLDGRTPGVTPPALWGAASLAGHPGFVEVPPVEAYRPQTLSAAQQARMIAQARRRGGSGYAKWVAAQLAQRWFQIGPAVVARRWGPAWLLVENGGTAADDLRDLESLRVTRLAP